MKKRNGSSKKLKDSNNYKESLRAGDYKKVRDQLMKLECPNRDQQRALGISLYHLGDEWSSLAALWPSASFGDTTALDYCHKIVARVVKTSKNEPSIWQTWPIEKRVRLLAGLRSLAPEAQITAQLREEVYGVLWKSDDLGLLEKLIDSDKKSTHAAKLILRSQIRYKKEGDREAFSLERIGEYLSAFFALLTSNGSHKISSSGISFLATELKIRLAVANRNQLTENQSARIERLIDREIAVMLAVAQYSDHYYDGFVPAPSYLARFEGGHEFRKGFLNWLHGLAGLSEDLKGYYSEDGYNLLKYEVGLMGMKEVQKMGFLKKLKPVNRFRHLIWRLSPSEDVAQIIVEFTGKNSRDVESEISLDDVVVEMEALKGSAYLNNGRVPTYVWSMIGYLLCRKNADSGRKKEFFSVFTLSDSAIFLYLARYLFFRQSFS